MIADVDVDDCSNPTVLRIRLKRTKTQQFKAVDNYLGRTNDELCPVAALVACLYCSEGHVCGTSVLS